VPLLAGLGALLGTLDSNAGRCFPATDRGWLKSCRLGTNSVMGGDATPSFSGALGGVGQRVERSQKCSTMCATSGRPYQCPPRVTARHPPSTGLIIEWVPPASFRHRLT
jgi:hypothetical protein